MDVCMDACRECVEMKAVLVEKFRTIQPILAALGSETRQSIFLVLLESDQVGLRVGELTERTHLSRPTLSHHLRILRDAGMVQLHRDGTRNYYYLSADPQLWTAFRDLADHICTAAARAAEEGYPNLKEP